jgi:plastocyanin
MRGIRIAAVAAVAAVLVVVATGVASAASPKKLTATVGPGYTITLVDSSGKRVTRLKAGKYVITVHDLATDHNFELRGGGLVEQETSVPDTGTVKWTLVLKKGSYTYVCDPHADMMRGSFVVT